MLHSLQEYQISPTSWIIGSSVRVGILNCRDYRSYDDFSRQGNFGLMGLPVVHDDSLLPESFRFLDPYSIHLVGRDNILGFFNDYTARVSQQYREVDEEPEEDMPIKTEPVDIWDINLNFTITNFNPRAIACGKWIL